MDIYKAHIVQPIHCLDLINKKTHTQNAKLCRELKKNNQAWR